MASLINDNTELEPLKEFSKTTHMHKTHKCSQVQHINEP